MFTAELYITCFATKQLGVKFRANKKTRLHAAVITAAGAPEPEVSRWSRQGRTRAMLCHDPTAPAVEVLPVYSTGLAFYWRSKCVHSGTGIAMTC